MDSTSGSTWLAVAGSRSARIELATDSGVATRVVPKRSPRAGAASDWETLLGSVAADGDGLSVENSGRLPLNTTGLPG